MKDIGYDSKPWLTLNIDIKDKQTNLKVLYENIVKFGPNDKPWETPDVNIKGMSFVKIPKNVNPKLLKTSDMKINIEKHQSW